MLTRIINFPIFGEPGDDGRKITGQARDRQAYASGLPVPHLAGLVYLVKIGAQWFRLTVDRNERHEALERLELLKLIIVPIRQIRESAL